MKRLRTPKRIRIPDATALGGDVIEILLSHREDAHGLRNLAEHTIELFNTPTEPTMRRLFQTTYDDDPVAEARYVEKTRGRLIARKREDATRAISVFNTGKPGLASFKIRTDRAHALNVLGFLNDARLIMGTRLNIQQGETRRAEIRRFASPAHPDRLPRNRYLFLTHLEFKLLAAVRGAFSP